MESMMHWLRDFSTSYAVEQYNFVYRSARQSVLLFMYLLFCIENLSHSLTGPHTFLMAYSPWFNHYASGSTY